MSIKFSGIHNFGTGMNKSFFLYSIVFLLMISACEIEMLSAQENKLIQISGIVVTVDSLEPVPYTTVIIKNSYRGTISDFYGFFSLVARNGDTLVFSSVGRKTMEFVVPEKLDEYRFSLIQTLPKDTLELQPTAIYPWPSKEEFKQAFLELQAPDDNLAIAERNLRDERLRELAAELPLDGSGNFKFAMQQEYSRVYYAGQLPPNNLLNPIAWAKFIKAWKDGTFKRDRKD